MKYLLILISFVFAVNINAQVVDKTKDKAKNKTNRRIDNKIDNGIDKGLDSIEGLFKKKKKKKKKGDDDAASEEGADVQDANKNGMFSMGGDADVKESYSFNHEIEYHSVSKNKKGKVESEGEMTMYISDEEMIFGSLIKSPDGTSNAIFDYEKGQMISLNDTPQMKMGMVINIDKEQIEEFAEEESKTSDYKYYKSGRTKDILGYSCEEWIMEDGDNRTEVWVSEEVNINLGKAFNAMSQSVKSAKMGPEEYPSGTMLEVNSKDMKSGETYHMVATRVEENSNPTISTKGYQFMNMGGK